MAVIIHEGKVLLGKKRFDSKGMMSGKWHIPGETLEEGETDEQGLIRGIMEEVGIDVRPGKHLGSYKTSKGMIVNWYECVPLTPDIKVGSDLEDAMWVPFEEVLVVCHKDAISLWPREVLEYFQE